MTPRARAARFENDGNGFLTARPTRTRPRSPRHARGSRSTRVSTMSRRQRLWSPRTRRGSTWARSRPSSGVRPPSSSTLAPLRDARSLRALLGPLVPREVGAHQLLGENNPSHLKHPTHATQIDPYSRLATIVLPSTNHFRVPLVKPHELSIHPCIRGPQPGRLPRLRDADCFARASTR
jgi:hypothetical protein